MSRENSLRSSPVFYNRYLLCIAGLGGLLYGIDVGIISSALLYLSKTVDLTVSQTSAIVAAVLGGSMISSLIAGFLADWFGRKKIVILSGFLFVASVILIVLSHGFVPLLLGRLLQGLSGGVIAVVVPLYLAECLSAGTRGRGSAIFQFMLTFGIVTAALTGLFYIHQAEAAIAAAAGNADLIRAAQDHAWRGMFLTVIYPGIAFFAGAFFLSETPRWLFREGRLEEAGVALRRASSEEEAAREMREMQELAVEDKQMGGAHSGSLLQRKYVFPFVLACVILTLNQATGINSVLPYLIVMLKQAGMSATQASQGDLTVKLLNCVMTIVAVALIDRKGRKFLLSLGTGGIVIAMLGAAFFFYSFESHRIDISSRVKNRVQANRLNMSSSEIKAWAPQEPGAMGMTILYSYGGGDRLATLVSSEAGLLKVAPEADVAGQPLRIKRAFLSRVPTERTGWFVTFFLALFITCYSVGPGVVVWLILSELMPTRIRSAGMGIALLLNQGASTLIAGVFLPFVSSYGYYSMFLFWAGCTAVYFATAVLFLPETKGKTLEEIERLFEPVPEAWEYRVSPIASCKGYEMAAENLMVVQGGGPTAVFNASLAGVLEEALAQPRSGKIFGARSGMKGLSSGDTIDLSGLSSGDLSAIASSPGAALGSSRFKPSEDDLDRCVRHLRALEVRSLIFMGGNGTMRGAQLFGEFCRNVGFDLQIIGVPKTIDNDIAGTDRCPGFGSAARFVAQSTLDLAMDIRSLPQPVSIFETLGRDVGWLAASATLARRKADDAPQLVYVPEIPFSLSAFLGDLDTVVSRVGWAVVVVSEGIADADGTPVFEQRIASPAGVPGRPLIGGVAQYLSGVVAERLGIRCRSEKPGLIGRSAMAHVSEQDRKDARMVGRAGVRALMSGATGQMVALRSLGQASGEPMEMIPLREAGGPSRRIAAEWIARDGSTVTEAFVEYVRPIVGELNYYPLSP